LGAVEWQTLQRHAVEPRLAGRPVPVTILGAVGMVDATMQRDDRAGEIADRVGCSDGQGDAEPGGEVEGAATDTAHEAVPGTFARVPLCRWVLVLVLRHRTAKLHLAAGHAPRGAGPDRRRDARDGVRIDPGRRIGEGGHAGSFGTSVALVDAGRAPARAVRC